MSTDYKPQGFHAITPYLIVEGANRLIAFLKEAFGAEEIIVMPSDDGGVMHAGLRVGDSVVELSDAGGQWRPMPAALHFYVPDVDTVYERALAAGAQSISAPQDMFYGERAASVEDPAGNHWHIATLIEELSDEEIHRRAEAAKTGG